MVPTGEASDRAAEFERAHPEFPGQLRTALATGGFDPGAFAPFFEDYARHVARAPEHDLEPALDAMQARLVGPIGLLLHTGRPLSWF